jgi:hypothetical protein
MKEALDNVIRVNPIRASLLFLFFFFTFINLRCKFNTNPNMLRRRKKGMEKIGGNGNRSVELHYAIATSFKLC